MDENRKGQASCPASACQVTQPFRTQLVGFEPGMRRKSRRERWTPPPIPRRVLVPGVEGDLLGLHDRRFGPCSSPDDPTNPTEPPK